MKTRPSLKLFILLSILLSGIFHLSTASASTRVAFMVFKKWNGQPWILEKNGTYSHIAIEVEGLWLHAHPVRGVELVPFETLQSMGEVKEIIEVKNKTISIESILKYLGKAYDAKYSWQNEAFYCSELIAKILKIKPQKMYFDSELWPASYAVLNGKKGISPDDIYLELSKPQVSSCSLLFR